MQLIYNNKHTFVVLLILLVASAVRLYNFTEVPFTDDEFSAISRLGYDSFSELMEHGVKVDGHPAGHHLFLYYFTKTFGLNRPALKLVNIVLGILGILLIYLIGKVWFNKSAGVFASAIFATLQYNIVNSQIARMYGFGIFFVLLATYCISLYIRRSERIHYLALILYVLSATIAAYSHYFSFLCIGIITLSVWLIEKAPKRNAVLIAGITILLLFIPHIKITLYQLGIGGIEGWLGELRFSFFTGYFKYLVHHSWLVLITIVLVIIFGLKGNAAFAERRYRWIALIWFLMPIIIGSAYSYFKANLMHERVLYFSFPFLILFLASFIRTLNVKQEFIMVFVLVAVNVSTLVLLRHHYELIVNDRFKLVAEKSVQWESELTDVSINAISTRPEIGEFYEHEFGKLKNKTILLDTISLKQYSEIIKNDTSEYHIFGNANQVEPTFFTVANHYFPNIVKRKYTMAGNIYLLSKSNEPKVDQCTYFAQKLLSNEEYAGKGIDSVFTDTLSGNIWYHISNEYAATTTFTIDEITFSKNNTIDITLMAHQIDSTGGAMIVTTIEKDGVTYDWRAKSFNEFLNPGDTAFVAFNLFLPVLKYPKGSELKIFIWNKDKGQYSVSNIEVKTNAGNPFTYGYISKIPFDLSKFCM